MLILIKLSPHLRRLHSLITMLECCISQANERTHRYTVLDIQWCKYICVSSMFGSEIKSLFTLHDKQWKGDMPCIHNDSYNALKLNPLIVSKKYIYRLASRPEEIKYRLNERVRTKVVMYDTQFCCLESCWFIMYSVVLSRPLWCRCRSFCFIATGYSIGFGQWYRRYCGICISFPQSPVGQPGAVYLSGYKAASQRAKGKGNGTEVSVGGTGCHCVFQQGCEICKCLRYSWRRLQKSKGCLRFMNTGIHVQVFPSTPPHISVHTAQTYTHANMNANVLTLQHFASTPSAEPFPVRSPFILKRFVQPAPFYLFSQTCALCTDLSLICSLYIDHALINTQINLHGHTPHA